MAWVLGVVRRGNSQNRGSQLPRPMSPSIWSNFLFSLITYTTCLWVEGSPGRAGSGRAAMPDFRLGLGPQNIREMESLFGRTGHFARSRRLEASVAFCNWPKARSTLPMNRSLPPRQTQPGNPPAAMRPQGASCGPRQIDQGHGVVARIGRVQRLSVGTDARPSVRLP